MKGTAWRVYLGIGALATGAYYLLPYDPAGAVLNLVVGASAVAAIAAGVRWHRPVRRLPWWLLAAAQGLFVAGDALFSVNDLVLGIEPFPSLADALYLPGYPVLAAGLALLALSRSTSRDWAGLTDAAIIAIGFGLLSWVLVMVPYFQDPSLGMVELLVSLAYPVGDVLLLALAARLATTPGRRHRVPAADRQPGGGRTGRPALLILQRLRGSDIEVAAIAGAWAVLFVLVMTRMAGLVRAIERAEAERRRLLDRTVQAAEEEHMHVATELHDGPIQRLAVLSYDLERAKQRMLGNPAAVARVEHAQAALSTAVQGLRELMRSLRPPTLDEVGLEAALRDHVGAFARRSGVDCSAQVHLDGRLDGELETVVYRVAQEALLLVRDGRFGLVAMQERVEMAGGRFQVNTRPGAGVVLRAMFRVPPAA